MRKLTIFVLFLSLVFLNPCFAQGAPTGQIERSQEILEKEKVLRKRIEKEEKIFIKKIIVKGVNLLTEEEIKEIILPFQNRWFSKEEIQQILDSFTVLYKKKGYTDQPAEISFKIKKGYLKISVNELSH